MGSGERGYANFGANKLSNEAHGKYGLVRLVCARLSLGLLGPLGASNPNFTIAAQLGLLAYAYGAALRRIGASGSNIYRHLPRAFKSNNREPSH